MPPPEFEPAIPASERPQTHALDCAATGIGTNLGYCWPIPLVSEILVDYKQTHVTSIPLQLPAKEVRLNKVK